MTPQSQFTGFNDDKSLLINIPYAFLNELLSAIDDLDELRLTILLLSCLSLQGENGKCISYQALSEEDNFINRFGNDLKRLDQALGKCLARNTLIKFSDQIPDGIGDVFFLNTRNNQVLVEDLVSGKKQMTDVEKVFGIIERPNIFKLYEENIGLMTPMLAEILKEDEKSFPGEWISDAIKIAVQHNARNWKYVHAILESWQKEGRDGKNGQNLKKNRRKDYDSWLK